jgi:hypothetical protein
MPSTTTTAPKTTTTVHTKGRKSTTTTTRPPTTTTTVPTPTTTTPHKTLAYTGADVGRMTGLALVLIAFGSVLLGFSAWKRRTA